MGEAVRSLMYMTDIVFLLSPRRIRLRRTFSVVPPCEAFASLFLHAVFDYRQKNRSNTLSSVAVDNFMNNPGYLESVYKVPVF